MTYKTRDFNEAALLLTFQIPLLQVNRDQGVCHFEFLKSSRVEGLTESFWRGDLTGNLRQFADAQRRVKDLIHRDGNGDQSRGNRK